MEMKNGFNFDGAKSTISGVHTVNQTKFLNLEKVLIITQFMLELILTMIMVGENIPNHILILFTVI